MTPFLPSTRTLLMGALVLALLSTSGCGWIKRKFDYSPDYEGSVQNQPLEVPPGLDAPRTAGAVAIPDVGTGAAAGQPGTVPPAGSADPAAVAGIADFALADSVDSAFRRIGLALERTEGVTINNRAQLINSYEVVYQGQVLLVRAEPFNGGTRVTAVGTDGQPLTSGAAARLLAVLKARLG